MDYSYHSLNGLQSAVGMVDLYQDFRPQTMVNPKQKILTRNASTSIKRLVFHCADEEKWSPDRLSQFFVTERGFPICAYHYYITPEAIFHMVGENVITYHAAPYNSDSVAFSIAFFASRDEKLNVAVNPKLIENATKIATFLCLKYRILPIDGSLVGHRELFGTGWFKDNQDHHVLRKTCPGLTIDLDHFRYQVARECQRILGVTVDGIIGPKSREVFKTLSVF
jgi:hypothetical protein